VSNWQSSKRKEVEKLSAIHHRINKIKDKKWQRFVLNGICKGRISLLVIMRQQLLGSFN
jgi:uncharacterized protein with ParB-like and HNH nuclease domain